MNPLQPSASSARGLECVPTMPWNECPPSRGMSAHLPWNTHHAVTVGLSPEEEASLSRGTAEECEAQKIEALRFAESASSTSLSRIAAELNQTGLVRMEREIECLKPFTQRIEETACVLLVLEAGHKVSGAVGSHRRALAEPYVILSHHTAPVVRPRP